MFDNYIDTFYAIKSEEGVDPFKRKTFKIHLNGLHGRFGVRSSKTMSMVVNKVEADRLDGIYNLIDKVLIPGHTD